MPSPNQDSAVKVTAARCQRRVRFQIQPRQTNSTQVACKTKKPTFRMWSIGDTPACRNGQQGRAAVRPLAPACDNVVSVSPWRLEDSGGLLSLAFENDEPRFAAFLGRKLRRPVLPILSDSTDG